MYYMDHGQYPSSASCSPSGPIVNSINWCNSVTGLSNGRWISGGALAPYIAQDPIDPTPEPLSVWNSGSNTDGGVYYYYSASAYSGCANGQYYFIIAGMELASNRKNTYVGCNGSTQSSGGSYNRRCSCSVIRNYIKIVN